jgi:hypothetical protein
MFSSIYPSWLPKKFNIHSLASQGASLAVKNLTRYKTDSIISAVPKTHFIGIDQLD